MVGTMPVSFLNAPSMKIPKILRINGLKFRVTRDKNVAREGNCYGAIHHYTQNIFIDPDAKEDRQEQAFLHEIIHAVFETSGLHVRYQKQPELEEELTTTLASGLYQVLKENNLLK